MPVFRVVGRQGEARSGVLTTAHGVVRTPAFMPVGTQGAVKALSPEDMLRCGTQILLANTYHLYLRPGEKLIKKLGGLHQYMRWQGPILTDSGGYQVSSLMSLRKIDDDGVTFVSHLNGSQHRLTPEKAIQIQRDLGVDIIMAFDEATPDKGKDYAREAMERTHRWLVRCKREWQRRPGKQLLFGIIQGGNYRDLRRESAKFVVEQDLPGIAVGGGSIGRDAGETAENVAWIRDILPQDKPVYLMGVGVRPKDIVAAVEAGADMFDCVAPTRLARMGQLYHPEFKSERLNIDNAQFRQDKGVIMAGCDCYTCQEEFSRSYLHHLFRAKELLYYRLASLHNVRFMIRLSESLRKRIK